LFVYLFELFDGALESFRLLIVFRLHRSHFRRVQLTNLRVRVTNDLANHQDEGAVVVKLLVASCLFFESKRGVQKYFPPIHVREFVVLAIVGALNCRMIGII
jgi:hypothetical protein